jgi:hypothetical protein
MAAHYFKRNEATTMNSYKRLMLNVEDFPSPATFSAMLSCNIHHSSCSRRHILRHASLQKLIALQRTEKYFISSPFSLSSSSSLTLTQSLVFLIRFNFVRCNIYQQLLLLLLFSPLFCE